MNSEELNCQFKGELVRIVGEQFFKLPLEDGHHVYSAWFHGLPVTIQIEPLGEGDSLLRGSAMIGGAIQDVQAAHAWVHETNQQIRFGRINLVDDKVVFTCHLVPPVDEHSVRWLLSLVASEHQRYPDLAEATGALTPADAASLERGDVEG